MHNDNWDDLRYVLMVAETGSVLRAAKNMGVNHATVLRHVASFEARHGESIFEKTPQGYRVLPDRAHVITAAQKVAAAMNEVGRLASGGHSASQVSIRISSTDTLCAIMLPRFVAEIAENYDEVAMTLRSSNTHDAPALDGVQITVRPAQELPQDLVGEVAAELVFGVYATSDDTNKWLGLSGPLNRSMPARWMAENVAPEQVTCAADSFLSLRQLAANGRGMVPLPCFVGDPDDRLVRIPDKMPTFKVPVWVAHATDIVPSPVLRDVLAALKSFLSAQQATFSG